MHARARLVLLLLIIIVLVIGSASAVAAPVPAAVPDVLAAEGPAVEVPEEAEDETEKPWTQRFLAPATLLLGALALGGSLLYYGVRVRGRYRVTE
jgi:hypothetical protein